jgi:hypothetical protein
VTPLRLVGDLVETGAPRVKAVMSQPPKTLQLTSRKTLAFSLSFLTLMATLTITAEEGRMRLKAVQPWVFDDLHAWSFAPTPGCMTNGIPSAALGAGLVFSPAASIKRRGREPTFGRTSRAAYPPYAGG